MPLAIELPDRGVLFVLSGPSGVGKSTLIRHALAVVPGLGFSVSATTRAPRPGEVDGEHYHFLSPEQFAQAVARGAFLEHAEVYGTRYGTLAAPVEAALSAGRSILLDVDVQGAASVREGFPEAVTIFVLPPSREALEARLRGRAADDEATIQRRLADADMQFRGCGSYDHLVVNDDLDTAKMVFAGVLLAALTATVRRPRLVARWTAEPDEG